MNDEPKRTEKSLEDAKSVQEVSSGLPGVSRGKTHADYWLKKVFRPKYQTEDGARETGSFSVKVQFAGRRELFPLNTANRAEAARKAKQIWATLTANGWEKALVQFKPHAVFVPPDFVTVGDYLDFLEKNHLYSPQSLHRNITKLFTALRSIFKDADDKVPMRLRRAKLKAENERLRGIRLSDLHAQRIESWKGRYLAARSSNPVESLAAKHTLDSYIRASKSMFGPMNQKRLAAMNVSIPVPIPFSSTAFVSRGRSAFRYRSRMNPMELTKLAVEELPLKDPELLKIFLLALHLGLRRNEIDKLMWSQFDFENRLLRIEVTIYAQLKAEGSEDDLCLEPELAEFFQRTFKQAKGIFVIESPNMPLKSKGWQNYRAHGRFGELCDWLRSKGVNAQKPIHTLRKEFGKLITEKMGLFAASRALRHSNTTVTATYYSDDTREKTTGLGKLLSFANVSG